MTEKNNNQLAEELNSLIKSFKPYQSVINIKLNRTQTLLCYEHNNNEKELKNDGKIIDEATYDKIRTTLQNKRGNIDPKNLPLQSAKKQIIAHLIKENELEDQEEFLKEFEKFINSLPEVPNEFFECANELMKINFDEWDIDESADDDPRFIEIQEINKRMLSSFEACKNLGEHYVEQKNQLAKDSKDKSQSEELLPFEKKYPKQSAKVKRIFEILNTLERCKELDDVIRNVANIFRLSPKSVKKLIDYFNARIAIKPQKFGNIIENNYWYTGEDMNIYGRALEKYGVDLETQFANRLTQDDIKILPSFESLKENYPKYICYNLGGKANEDNSGMHWVAIFLVKRGGNITILYKDSKGDWNQSSDAVETLFKEHYMNKVEFIRHSGAEQEDESSCGPMTINNLEIMALTVKEANDQGKDGVSEMIRLFNDKSGTLKFTTQDQVSSLRTSHLLQGKLSRKESSQQDLNIDDLNTIIEKLELNEISTQESDEKQSKNELKIFIHKINQYYDQLKDWGADKIKRWSNENKGKLSKNFDGSQDKMCEAIAVMDRANELATGGHRLRDTQKSTILIFIQSNAKGHISQINTGEGKTTIISVVATLKVMQGYQGHVITSNNVLAADGVKDKRLFYELLDISVADNNPDDQYTEGSKACYKRDIVYGSITNFQFDWLRDSFEKLNTMDGIDFNNVWVMLDEIDSLLIDQGSNIAKLSGPFPGMESLRYVYINIWVALAKAEENVTKQMLEKLTEKAESLEVSDINEDQKQQEYEEYEDNLRGTFLDEVKEYIKNQKDDLINKKIVAKHLHQYAADSLDRWIEIAFSAKYQFNENVEYKIIKDKDGENIIIPVDNQNTGVSMKNTILSNGMHQFLQIKHNLCLTYESLTSCYISNLDYIRKYGNKLTGVTGTLGSKPERNLLGSVFNLGFSIIPPFKSKKFIQFPGKVCFDEEFTNDIAIAALGELTRSQGEIKTPRAVLIVCASILDAEIIANEIETEAEEAGLSPKIKKYANETDAHITEDTLEINDIVIATNLAGRGTDFKTSAILESNGGLHVIEAFLPCNKRVEDQGLGRTARQGNKGTGQIIIRSSEVEALGISVNDLEYIDFDEIIERRDELESFRVEDIADNKVTELEFKGQLFNKFSLQYAALKQEHKIGIGNDVIKWIYVLRDLKEKWAFWLEKQAYTAKSIKDIITKQQSYFSTKNKDELLIKAVDQEYNKFLKEAKTIIKGTISHNPYYSICLSERYFESSNDKSSRVKAKDELKHALKISESSELLFSAYIKLFEIAIEDGGQILIRYARAIAKIFDFPLEKSCPNYKKDAKENLQKAAQAIAVEHDYLQQLFENKNTTKSDNQETALEMIVQEQNLTINSERNLFVKHLQARLVCLGAYKGNIESLIKQLDGEEKLENPQDLIGVNDGVTIGTKVPKYLSKLDSENELKKLITDRSVDELEYVGMSSIYQVRKIHDVHEEVITGAQVQIGGAFALLASAAAFPVLLPVNGPIASAMISEGITDIITALIQQGQTGFNKKDYIKGKVISYGITLATMGIGALMSSTKVLQKAVNTCRSLAAKLRAVKGPFAGICKFLANQLDKIAIYLELVIEKIEFARKTAMEQAKYLAELKDVKKFELFQQLQKTIKMTDVVVTNGQMITQIVKQAVIGSVQGVVISVAMERIVIASLNKLMTDLKPIIEKNVKSSVRTKINHELKKGTFDNVSELEINQSIVKLFNTSLAEDVNQVSKEIGLGIMRHSSNWKMQLVALAADSILSGIDVATCTNAICDKFIANLTQSPKEKINNDSDKSELIETIITQISDQTSDMIYNKIVAITGKIAVTLPKALYRRYKSHQENKADKKAESDMNQKSNQIEAADDAAKAENAKCVHDAVSESLGLDNNKGSKQLADASNLVASTDGASIDDAKQLYKQNGIEVTSGPAENAQVLFKEQGSDRGVACLSGNEGGHSIAVTMENGSLMVKDGDQKVTLAQYQQDHGYTKAELIVPKNVNNSTMQNIKHQVNLNRIVRATQPIDSVGKGDGEKFGEKPETRAKLKKQREDKLKAKEKLEMEIKEALKDKPVHSMKGSDVLKQSEGTIGQSDAEAHARSHTTFDNSGDKKVHSVFSHGEKQQDYLMNQASKNSVFLDNAKKAQTTRKRQVFSIPIGDLLSKNLSPSDKKMYMQMQENVKKASFNMKSVTFVVDPAVPGSGRPYQLQTFYPVSKK